MSLDSRINAYRPDLARASLVGRVIAERYVKGDKRRVAAPRLGMYARKRGEGPMVSEALLGEEFIVLDVAGHWAWGQLASDDYVGYVLASRLAPIESAVTHRVAVPSSFIFSAPDLKSKPLKPLWLNSRLTVAANEGLWSAVEGGGFVFTRHLAGLDAFDGDYVAAGKLFLNVPYLWGGRTSAGLDCSGLVQTAMHAAGRDCPRDSDMMETALGTPLPSDDLGRLQRGDLVFWTGHLGIMVDAERLLHANAHHLRVVIEPLRQAVERIAATGNPITSIRRPDQ